MIKTDADVDVERRWLCDTPEYVDDACLVDHKPDKTSQPRKHVGCGWYFVVKDPVQEEVFQW